MTSPATAAVASTGTSTPSVLALIVVGPGVSTSLRDCLLSIAHQSYPRVGVPRRGDGADADDREMLSVRSVRAVQSNDGARYARSFARPRAGYEAAVSC